MKEYPAVVWFTGLSGAGKTTLAEKLISYLQQNDIKCELLDGDIVRDIFPRTGFSEAERNEHIKRMGFLASMLEKHGVLVVASFISPYRESRNFVRRMCKKFVEIYVSTPLSVCEKRDVKGLYKKARNGGVSSFTGIDSPYEVPENPELTIDTSSESVEKSFQKLLDYLNLR